MSLLLALVLQVQMDETVKRSTARALEWLASQQNADGSWGNDGKYPHSTSVTSFALISFLSQGHLPGQGLYGPEVAKGARFLVASTRPTDGYLVGSRGGNMYAHGMATLALAELWGMAGGDEIRPPLEKAVELIVRTQSKEGGWRYDPQPTGHDISVTIMQVMALRAAKNSGLHVPDATIQRALGYINSCYHKASGGYVYQPGNNDPGFARTAAGVCVLQLSGKYDATEIEKAIDFLEKKGDDKRHWWYGQYYAAHAMHQVGGKKWEDWYARLRTRLLAKQDAKGAWVGGSMGSDDGVGGQYQTAIAVIILSIPLNYLPIFQN
ncbi:MAG TPA: prenyltransferase/squalene oxidase repeat-containing protein [Planctomycetota bacterium]